MLKQLQKLGKALMLPIAVLPVAGLLLRFGQPDLLNIPFIANAGDAVFSNLALLFAIGIAIGFADDSNGAAGLAGAISYFVLKACVVTINTADHLTAIGFEGMKVDMGALGGIIAGVLAGILYNRFKAIKLPDWLGFFGGRRFVPIVSGGASLVLGGVFGYVWPYIQSVIGATGDFITSSGAIGAFIFGFLNRLLIPFGLHHVINTITWFQFGSFTNAAGEVVNGDLWRFFANDPTAGTFMAGFFPVMMFGLPAAALAMYLCAKPENKAAVGGALFSVALTAFLTGITEPIEFMFMFLAPALYAVHAVLTGVALAACDLLNIKLGFTFSAGATDYLLNFNISTNPVLGLVVGVVFFFIYLGLFIWFIKTFDIKTPGREDDTETTEFAKISDQMGFDELASAYIRALGGGENILEIESCITRIRLTLRDNKALEEKAFKALGASGLMKAGSQATQVIVGTKAEFLVDAMKKQLVNS